MPALARTLTDRLARSLSDGASEALAVVAAWGGSPSRTRCRCWAVWKTLSQDFVKRGGAGPGTTNAPESRASAPAVATGSAGLRRRW